MCPVQLRVVDGNPATKWLDFGGVQPGGSWIEYALPAGREPVRLGSYALTSADDAPERDPRAVVLEAWDKGQQQWAQLDEQRDLAFERRGQRVVLSLGAAAAGGLAAKRFRLRILEVRDLAAANSVQLACWDMFVAAALAVQQQQPAAFSLRCPPAVPPLLATGL